jgi:hypothetical protein
MKRHLVGQLIYLGNHSSVTDEAGVQVGAFKNAAGQDTDPTTVTLRIEDGAGEVEVYTWPSGDQLATKEAGQTGRFYVPRTPSTAQAGVWHWRLEGTGAVQTAIQGRFYIVPARPAP